MVKGMLGTGKLLRGWGSGLYRWRWDLAQELEADPDELVLTGARSSDHLPFLIVFPQCISVKPFLATELVHHKTSFLYWKRFPTKTHLSSPFGWLQIHGERSSLVWFCRHRHFLSSSSLSPAIPSWQVHSSPVILTMVVRLNFLCRVFLVQKIDSNCYVIIGHCLGRKYLDGRAYNVSQQTVQENWASLQSH